MEQQLKEQTINELKQFYNNGISNIIVNYLIITREEYLEDCIITLGIAKIVNQGIILYNIKDIMRERCIICSNLTIAHIVDINSIHYDIYPTGFNRLCLSCSPYFLCQHSKHLEDFKRKCKANNCWRCNKTICHEIIPSSTYSPHGFIEYKKIKIEFPECNSICENCYKVYNSECVVL